MSIVFLLGSPDIGGGTYVIFQHALKCLDEGNEVTIVTDEDVTPKRISWHNGAERLTFKKYKDVEDKKFDIVIATWWRTVYELPRINASSYIYFVQSIESKFYNENELALRWFADASYTLPLSIITEATWIKEYLEERYSLDVKLVKNGIRKEIYTLEGEKYDKDPGKFRVLVEGPIDVFFKNVPNTIKLVSQSKADEIWLLSSSDIKEYPGVDRVFSRMPISECAKIYRSCDVMVKLSYVEGMFGPPLEMFHCGGTAITYDVTGHDEYLKNNVNSIVVPTDDEAGVINAINRLYDDRKLLEKLKKEAIKTADKWPDWNKSSDDFYKAVMEFSKIKLDSEKLNSNIAFLWETYVILDKKEKSTKTKIGDFLRAKMPFIYKCYRFVRYGKRV